MSQRRVTVYRNSSPSSPQLITLPSNCDLPQVLYLCGQSLSMVATKVFHKDGAEITSPHLIRDGDILFVSQGEAFRRDNLTVAPSTSTSSPTASPSSAPPSSPNLSSAPSSPSKLQYSIAVMGSGGVGKSALTLRFVQGKFVSNYDPTIEDAYRKTVVFNGETTTLDILDTAGQEDYVALRSTWMRGRDGFVLVFSLCDRSSFNHLDSFYDSMVSLNEDGLPPLILVGNKSDLESKRAITTEEGKQKAEQFGQCTYIEASAANGNNVEKIFSSLVNEIRSGEAEDENDGKKKKKWTFCNIL